MPKYPRRLSVTAITSWSLDIVSANKAPAGYGLGSVAQYIDDFNNAVLTGWYQNQSKGEEAHTPDGSIGWIVRTESYGTGCYAQFAFRVGSPPLGVYQAVRYYHSAMGGWNTWEWVNPPMILGVEYRTTERYLGKPVYCKVVDCGGLPNGTIKIVSHGVFDFGYSVRYCGSVSNSSSGFNGAGALPSISTLDALNGKWNVYVSDVGPEAIKIFCGGGLSECPAYVTIWYTKTTD